MKKFANIYDLVCRLTDDRAFRAFFTAYLMTESEEERTALSNRFWQELALQNAAEQQLLRAEFTRCFLKLPGLAAELHERAFNAANAANAA
ncbi:MAG: hypothetical protein J0L99_04645 [Chitinophagales bacterium]|nr:hypothetical protein [Chitinophagales bacterium]